MHACPFPGCDYKTLQKSNVQTHIRTHTREHPKECPEPGCAFTTSDSGTLTRHCKQMHGYEPKARRSLGDRASRQSAIAPYTSPQPIKAEVESPVSTDLNNLIFPDSELAGLITCDASSPAWSSCSRFSTYSNDLTDFSWEHLFPTLPTDIFPPIYSQPCQLPTFNRQRTPSISPISTCHSLTTKAFNQVKFNFASTSPLI